MPRVADTFARFVSEHRYYGPVPTPVWHWLTDDQKQTLCGLVAPRRWTHRKPRAKVAGLRLCRTCAKKAKALDASLPVAASEGGERD